MEDLDSDGDGTVSAGELAADLAARKAEILERLDANGNGNLEAEELAAAPRGCMDTDEEEAAADQVEAPKQARVIELPGTTLLPGLIDAHSHLLLHPYNETTWDDQVLKEPLAERICRATNHAKANLLSGFTTLRDLGTEGAGYADVGIKRAIEKGVIPGPRLLVTTKAIVASGSYAPAGFAPEWKIPQGADEADGANEARRIGGRGGGRCSCRCGVHGSHCGGSPFPWRVAGVTPRTRVAHGARPAL